MRRGLTQEPKKQITVEKQGSFYWLYRHVGSGARKLVDFLGPAGLKLVGRVDHRVAYQGSEQ